MSLYYIGTSAGSVVDIMTLSTDAAAPAGDFQRWTQVLDLGDALARGLGRPVASWYWGYIPVGLRGALLSYCPSKSARVYIRTRANPLNTQTGVYQAAMIWPDDDGLLAQNGFRIVFRDLVLQP